MAEVGISVLLCSSCNTAWEISSHLNIAAVAQSSRAFKDARTCKDAIKLKSAKDMDTADTDTGY